MNMKTMLVAVAACAGTAFGQTFNFGLFEGQWNNLTFGSTGSASFLAEDLGGGLVGLTIDLNGAVFGIGNPPPLVTSGTVVSGVFTLNPITADPTFGDVSGSVDAAGSVAIDLVNAAGGGFSLVTLRGTAIGSEIHLTYEIFDAFAPTVVFANGVIDATLVPSPGGVALIGLGGLVATRRRRG